MSHPALPGFLNSLAPLLNHYGYLALALVVTIESFGPPLPGETLIIAAALYAGAGELNIWAVFFIAFAAAVVGDNIGYAIGHFGGRRLIARYGRYIRVTEERFARAEGFFRRYGGRIVIVARFVEGLRQVNGIIAGTTGMPWRRFVSYNIVGAALWVGVWTTVGYNAGTHIQAIYNVSGYVAIGVGVLIVVALVGYLLWRRRRTDDDAAASVSQSDSAAGR